MILVQEMQIGNGNIERKFYFSLLNVKLLKKDKNNIISMMDRI